MATVGIKVYKHHKKADGTDNIKIRVSHKGGNHYIDTPLLAKYIKMLKLRYTSSENLDHVLNEGMRQICKLIAMPRITFYWARHSLGKETAKPQKQT